MHPLQPITTLINKPHRLRPRDPAAAHPQLSSIVQAGAPSPFGVRLSRVTVPLPKQPASTDGCLDGYARLVSAACYLRGKGIERVERQQAMDICLDLAERIGEETGQGTGRPDAAARRAKEEQWQRHAAVEAALHFLTNPERLGVTPSLQRESRWVRWRRRWHRRGRLQTF